VIIVNTERCTGCGACLEACPTGALYLVDGKATVDEAFCQECEACVASCSVGAIILATQEGAVAKPVQVPAQRPEGRGRREPEVIRIKAQPTALPLRTRVLPVLGAALVWAGREILPRLADFLLNALDRQVSAWQAAEAVRSPETRGDVARSRGASATGAGGAGQQHRHRRRKGNG
jgi:ferredoxin